VKVVLIRVIIGKK